MTTANANLPSALSQVEEKSSFGAELRAIREAAGLTCNSLAHRAGCDPSMVRHTESGAKRPSAELARQLDAALAAGGDLVTAWQTTQTPGRARPVHRPHQLPAAPPRLLGVDQAVERLDEAISHGAPVTLTGPAGAGKTALALRWAHQHQRRWPDGILALGCRGRSPHHRPRTAAELLGIAIQDLQPGKADGLAADVDGRVKQLRDLLHRRRVLLLLDDASDVEQVSPLLAIPNTTVLVTSRNWLTGLAVVDGAITAHTTALPPEHAARLLHVLVGPRAASDPAALERIVAACDGLPLALRAAAQVILSRPGSRLAGLACDLSGPLRVQRLHQAAGGDARASLDYALHASLRHVSQPAASLLLRETASMAVQTSAATDVLADELVREHLLTIGMDGYRYPPLVHAWAAQQPEAARPHHPGV